MSFTNQTQHYGLPQYIGSDVPAYLTDYNNAMATIDQGMNAAKTQADAAATAAGQAANDISSLNSTVGTQATQISAAAQAASAAQTTANTADSKADALDTRVTALENNASTALVQGTCGTINTPIDVNYPAGFNFNNSVISSFSVIEGGSKRAYGIRAGVIIAEAVLIDGAIRFVARDADAENRPVEILLTKIS